MMLQIMKDYLTNTVVYLDQLSGAARTQKLVEILFFSRFQPFCSFQTFFSDFTPEINTVGLKMSKLKVFFMFCLLLKAG